MSTGIKSWAAAIAVAAFMASPAFAEPPPHAGGKGNKGNQQAGQSHKGGKPDKSHSGGGHGGKGESTASLNLFFGDDRRSIIHDYYEHEFRGGHCPPGLAKKRNGCLPPGQAKKWRVGYPLPHDVIYYDLPDELLRRLGRTEEGYKLVRVGADILKIGIGTGLVVEAVEDLGGLF